MPGVIYYKESRWETYPGSKQYNFYIVAVDEHGEQQEHALNDWCKKGLPAEKANKTLSNRRAAFARCKITNWNDRGKKAVR